MARLIPALNKTYSGKTVLVTGHTGFKGAWLSLMLKELGSRIIGISLPPKTQGDLYNFLPKETFLFDGHFDICDDTSTLKVFLKYQPDFIFHLAAQPNVLESIKDPINTWKTNVLGTLNIVQTALSSAKVIPTIIITSDKVYKNLNNGEFFVESDDLKGSDPYSHSKVAAENFIESIKKSHDFNIGTSKIATARAGNVFGGGDWTNNRIVPDLFRAWISSSNLVVRNPHFVRPWQHVLEPLLGYLQLGHYLQNNNLTLNHSFNFGPDTDSQISVINLVRKFQLTPPVQIKESVSPPISLESSMLNLNSTLARQTLDWHPRINLEDSIALTKNWYMGFAKSEDLFSLTMGQIVHYFELDNI